MKRSPRPLQTPANFSDSIHRQLNMYALAATAAGVGMLALAPPAEAKIIYTPAHVILKAGQPFSLDLNHDGKVDFYLLHKYLSETSGGTNFLSACRALDANDHGFFCYPASTNLPNGVREVGSMGRVWGAALRSGARIQGGDKFLSHHPAQMGGVKHPVSNPLWYGPWLNKGKGVRNRFLGIKFKISGRFHFGWARITVTTTSNSFTATLTGYAYETIPGKSIIAGKTKGPDVITVQPASLGHLAAGASAIPAWRSGK